MNKLDFLNNFSDAICVFSKDNEITYLNNCFGTFFPDFKTLERFKKRFNFNLCFLLSENIKNLTPLDILLESKENSHTICTYQTYNEEYITYYVSKINHNNQKIVIFKDITASESINNQKNKYLQLQAKYNEIKESTQKYSKLQEHAQNQVLKMGIINRISLLIRETNNIETILASALEEIHNFLGAFKTYFSMKEKSNFRIKYLIPNNPESIDILTEYEPEVNNEIKNKNITLSTCRKEYLNAKNLLPNGINRIIIPVYNKNKLLGIIVSFTKQKIQIEENKEVLQSISVHLASSIIQAGLISQLNKKNKKLEKTLKELKDTQLQLINSEKMASIGQLVSGVAHEINTPLASINSNNSLINKILNSEEEITKENLELLKELNSIDIEASNRISNIVKSLKRFIRLDESEFQSADINKELDLTLKLIAHETKDNIKIIKNYSLLPPVMCSVNMLNQVFMNLLVNSCHSIQEKGGNGIIEISTMFENERLIVKIKDNGTGIPLNIQNKIFNTGFTTKKTGIGTGLGLSISKKIIEIHKGTITFTSKQDEGSEFIISIPCKSQIIR